MTLKLLIFLTTSMCFFVHGSDIERRASALTSSDYAESYITLEAAKELRNKLGIEGNQKQQQQQKQYYGSESVERQHDDYDEILKEIIRHLPKQQQPQKQHGSEIFYEKKYFDYLPNEISDSDDVASEELSHELVKTPSEYSSVEEEHKMRSKRDVAVDKSSRSKRQSIYYAIPLAHYNPYPNVHFYYPFHDPIFDSFPHPASESRSDFSQTLPNPNYNNPWTPQNMPGMKFYSGNNRYLPPPPPLMPHNTYLPSNTPTQQPPVNVPHPPDNQPSHTNNDNEPDDRISLFAGEDRNVWDSRPITVNHQSASNSRRPVPPVINPPIINPPVQTSPQRPVDQNHNRPNSIPIVAPNQKFPLGEFGIEYAPALEEDITTTTRASIKIPDRRNRNKHDNNRLKKSAFRSHF